MTLRAANVARNGLFAPGFSTILRFEQVVPGRTTSHPPDQAVHKMDRFPDGQAHKLPGLAAIHRPEQYPGAEIRSRLLFDGDPAGLLIEPVHAGIIHRNNGIVRPDRLDDGIAPISAPVGGALKLQDQASIRLALAPEEPARSGI